jgi:hypothetical protein
MNAVGIWRRSGVGVNLFEVYLLEAFCCIIHSVWSEGAF